MRLVNAEDLERVLWNEYASYNSKQPQETCKLIAHGVQRALEYLEETPPVDDAVVVVRCKDCLHLELDEHYGNHACAETGDDVCPDGYCHRGKRREQTHE